MSDLGAGALQFAGWRGVSRSQNVLVAGIGLGRLDIHTGAYPGPMVYIRPGGLRRRSNASLGTGEDRVSSAMKRLGVIGARLADLLRPDSAPFESYQESRPGIWPQQNELPEEKGESRNGKE